MSKDEIHYDITHISFLEKLWGDGYMSPGGKKEINRLLNGLDLTEKKILDVGCGAGGICLLYTSPSPRDKRQSRMPSSA